MRIQIYGLALLLLTYYVATTGNDGGKGSAALPWKTLQHAADSVAAGDTVVVRSGTYAGFTQTQSGSENSPIIFRAEKDVIIDSPNRTGDGIDLEGASDIVVEGFTVDNAKELIKRAGIRSVNNQRVTIRGNRVDRAGTWGFLSGFTDDLLIESNTFSRSKAEHGIYVSNSGDRPVIRGNTMWGNNGCGIHMNGDASMGGDGIISEALVEQNIIYDNARRGGSGINADGVQRSRFQNNLIYDNHSNGISLYRIDAAEPSKDNLVINNTILIAADGRWGINIMNGSTGNTVLNNILLNEHSRRGSLSISADSLAGFTSDFNAVIDRFSNDDGEHVQTLARWRNGIGQDKHSFITTPVQLFVQPAAPEFQLAPAGPAIDAGTSEKSPKTDRKGTTRPSGRGIDIGAMEHSP